MDIEETRRKRLREIIDNEYGGVQARFIAAIEENQGKIAAMLRGDRPFGERIARNLEAKMGKPRYYLDNIKEVSNGLEAEDAGVGKLYRLTSREINIIDVYRESAGFERSAIDAAVSAASQKILSSSTRLSSIVNGKE